MDIIYSNLYLKVPTKMKLFLAFFTLVASETDCNCKVGAANVEGMNLKLQLVLLAIFTEKFSPFSISQNWYHFRKKSAKTCAMPRRTVTFGLLITMKRGAFLNNA